MSDDTWEPDPELAAKSLDPADLSPFNRAIEAGLARISAIYERAITKVIFDRIINKEFGEDA